MPTVQKISPFLWFDSQAEEAVTFYVSVFKDSKITQTLRYGEAGKEHHRRPPGSVMTIGFELEGQPFAAINGGPIFEFNPAISFVISCQTQAEVDYYWEKLTEGGDPMAQQCGWLKDRFGVSWQVVPSMLPELLKSPAAMQAMMGMKKLDVAALQRASAE